MNNSDLIKFISDGFDKAKSGDALSIFSNIAIYQDNGTLPLKSHYAFGWIIYYALLQAPGNEIQGRKQMLARYLKLRLTVPHKLHSMILTQALRLYKDAKTVSFNRNEGDCIRFSIVGFSKLWNLRNLRPGDWNRKEMDGKILSSTVEKLITLYVDELEETRTAADSEFKIVIDKAVETYSDSHNLLNQRATLHLLSDEFNVAASLLRKALLMAPGKFHLWSKLASTVSPVSDPHLHTALLYKALKCPGLDQFKGRIRMSLAEVLAHRGAFPQAAWELQRIKSVYESNGWHLPKKYNSILDKIPSGTIADNPEKIYLKVEHLADDEIYRDLDTITVTKTYHKNPDSKSDSSGYGRPAVAWRVTDGKGNNSWMKPHRFNLDPFLPLGTALDVSIYNGKIVRAELRRGDHGTY